MRCKLVRKILKMCFSFPSSMIMILKTKTSKRFDLKRYLSIPFKAYPKLKSSLKKMRLLVEPKFSYPILTLMLLLSLELLVKKTPKVQFFSLNRNPLLFAHFHKNKFSLWTLQNKIFPSGLTCKHYKKNVWYMKETPKHNKFII
jgi:hypothetical protein